jgi:asparagine synthase (glutamine-hydrolysing)
MMAALSHHGNDGSHVWRNAHVGLGHQMFHITPESVYDNLEFESSLNSTVVAADARIDNREEIFSKLQISTARRPAMPDSHIILLAYERWGEACPEHLEGSYTFVVWDDCNRQLFCAVDALCTRSLYTYCTPGVFAFSTEIAGLLDNPYLSSRLDEAGFAQSAFLPKSDRDLEATCFECIKLMGAATTLTVTDCNVRKRRYWEPDPYREIVMKSEGEYLDQFRELFFDAVRGCLRSQFPVASLLSGGLDSSSIVCVAARLLGEQGRSLTAVSSVLPEGYPGPERDERLYIDMVKRQENIPVRYVHPPVKGLYTHLQKMVEQSGNPRMHHSSYLYSAFQKAVQKDNVRVVLCGAKGELGPSAHGDGYFPELAVTGKWIRLATSLRERARVEQQSYLRLFWRSVLMPLLPPRIAGLYARMRGTGAGTFEDSLLAQPEFFAQAIGKAGIDLLALFHPASGMISNERQHECRALLNSSIPNSWNTRPGEQEVWFPFANKRLIEFCLAVPGNMKIRHGWKRYLIRAGTEGILPPEIQWRKTKGPFSPDFFRRLQACRQDALDILSDIESDSGFYGFVSTYVDVKKIKKYAVHASPPETWEKWRGFDPYWQIVMRGINVLFFLRWARGKLAADRKVIP